MKRDMDLVRKLLLAIEAHPEPDGAFDVDVPGYPREQIMYHVQLLHEAGLVSAENVTTFNAFEWQVHSLTWSGHEFLDATRSDTIWRKIKTVMKDRGATLTFDLIKALAIKFTAAAIGLELKP